MGGRGDVIPSELVNPLLSFRKSDPKVVAEGWQEDGKDEDLDQAPSGNSAETVPECVEHVEDEEREHQIGQRNFT